MGSATCGVPERPPRARHLAHRALGASPHGHPALPCCGLGIVTRTSSDWVRTPDGRWVRASRRDPPREVGPSFASAATRDPHLFPQKREGYGGEHPNDRWPQEIRLAAPPISSAPPENPTKPWPVEALVERWFLKKSREPHGLTLALWRGSRRSQFPARGHLIRAEADAGSQASWRTGAFSLAFLPYGNVGFRSIEWL